MAVQPRNVRNKLTLKLDQRSVLIRSIRAILAILILAIIFVLLDYSIDFRPRQIQHSYFFNIKDDIAFDKPVILKQDNLAILIIKRSETMVDTLLSKNIELMDPESIDSQQPEFASNPLRSSHPQYFVSYGLGTDLGCLLTPVSINQLREICGDARYDFAGRAVVGKKSFHNLVVPEYEFSENFSTLIVKP